MVGSVYQLVRMERRQHERIYQDEWVNADTDQDPHSYSHATSWFNQYTDTDQNAYKNAHTHTDPYADARWWVNTSGLSGGELYGCRRIGIRYV